MKLLIIITTICILQSSIETKSGLNVKTKNNNKAYNKINEISDGLRNIPEDGRLNFTEMANKYGHACEEFDVVTEDGYILKIFRIPGNKRKPVLYNHGLFGSADVFILQNNKSLALALARRNYDVWAMNQRGNRYSRRHVTLDPDKHKRQFFNFSFDEVGLYDVPAVIDFILNYTGAKKLSYIGHSQGTTSILVLMTQRPKYNEKVSIAVLLAPSVFQQYAGGSLPVLHLFHRILQDAGTTFGVQEIFNHDGSLAQLFRYMCSSGTAYKMCTDMIFSSVGYNPEQLTVENFQTLLGQTPCGTSVRAALHYLQLYTTEYFRKFDFGGNNIEVYGSITPPSYDLTKATLKVALFYGLNDKIISVKDVDNLARILPNVVHRHIVEDKNWNHLDFIWAKDVEILLNSHVLNVIEKYSV